MKKMSKYKIKILIFNIVYKFIKDIIWKINIGNFNIILNKFIKLYFK